MEKAATAISLANLTQRRMNPDVPEDVDSHVQEALLHLNDPNWDLGSTETSSLSGASFDIEHKHKYESDVHIGPFLGTSPSDFDTESRVDSTYERTSESRLDGRLSEIYDYENDSPYAEVRASVANTDDPSMPVNTFRVWFLGVFFSIIVSAVNQAFSLRYPAVRVSSLVIQLIALPCGKALERLLPTRRFKTFGYVWTLNPGPFNIKEHAVITAMGNVSFAGVYANNIIATQRVYYNQNWGTGYQILLCLSTQLIGFSYAGIARRVLVWPAIMIYPGALVNCAVLNMMHKYTFQHDSKHISRQKFFLIATACSFVWYWFPGYIFTALSIFSWVCWIAPNNIVVNQLFGYSTGLGMGFLTFDWTMVSYIASPLVTPWWAQVNAFVAFFVLYWIVAPILYYKNVFFAKFLPMSASFAFDNRGLPYDPTIVIRNGVFNQTAYESYSPAFLSTTLALGFGSGFASITGVFVHIFLWYRRDIYRHLRSPLKNNRDVHSRLMSVYREAPDYWYAILGIISFVLAVITIEVFDTKLPVWALVFALFIGFICLIPVGIIQAMTNQVFPIQIFAELIAGYALPGRPVAVMLFKTYAYISLSQSYGFLADLKIGHYMKVPPRIMFSAQIVAAILSVFVCIGVQQFMFSNVPDLCSPHQANRFICPIVSIFATASLVWGGVGPQRLFSAGQLYNPILYFFLIGALLPIPFYLLARRYPLSNWRYVNIPTLFTAITEMPPATGINFSSFIVVGSIFQFFMRRYHFRWWMRYNYLLSAALDAGVAIAAILIFFFLMLPKGGIKLDWWGNNVYLKTLDAMGAPFTKLAKGETFGPKTWS